MSKQEHCHAIADQPKFSPPAAVCPFRVGRLNTVFAVANYASLASVGRIPMRGPPDFASASGANVWHREEVAICPKEVGLVPRRLRAESPYDDPTLLGTTGAEGFVQRFVTLLLRALATWPT